MVFFQEIKKHQDVALLDQRGKCGLVGEKGKHGVRFTEGAFQRTLVTIGESSWDHTFVNSLRSLLTSLDRQLRIKQMVCQTSVMECW